MLATDVASIKQSRGKPDVVRRELRKGIVPLQVPKGMPKLEWRRKLLILTNDFVPRFALIFAGRCNSENCIMQFACPPSLTRTV